jgi:hypothetical protein
MICKIVRSLFDQWHLSFGIALIPQPEQLIKVPLPELGEGFRERATKVRCSLPTRTRILVSINLRLI